MLYTEEPLQLIKPKLESYCLTKVHKQNKSESILRLLLIYILNKLLLIEIELKKPVLENLVETTNKINNV